MQEAVIRAVLVAIKIRAILGGGRRVKSLDPVEGRIFAFAFAEDGTPMYVGERVDASASVLDSATLEKTATVMAGFHRLFRSRNKSPGRVSRQMMVNAVRASDRRDGVAFALSDEGQWQVISGKVQNDGNGRILWSKGCAYLPWNGGKALGVEYARENSSKFFAHGRRGAKIYWPQDFTLEVDRGAVKS